MKKHIASLAVGSAFAAVALAPVAQAADNPFAATELKGGYQLAQADKKADAKCGGDKKAEHKCGAHKKAAATSATSTTSATSATAVQPAKK